MERELEVLLPLLVFAILDIFIFFNSLRNRIASKSRRFFRICAISVFLQQLMTAVVFAHSLGVIELPRVLHWLAFFIMYISMIFTGYYWFRYMLASVQGNRKPKLAFQILYLVPVVLTVINCILNIRLKSVYWIDEQNTFCTGTLYYAQSMAPYLYVVMSIGVILYESRKTSRAEVWKLFRNFIVFLIPCMIGLVVHVLFVRTGFAQIGISVGLLLVYLEQYMEEVKENARLENTNAELEYANAELETRLDIIDSMTSIYYASYYIDLDEDTYLEIKAKDSITEVIKNIQGAQKGLLQICENLIHPDFVQPMKEFLDLHTVEERLRGKNILTYEFIGNTAGWSMAYLIPGDYDDEGKLHHVFYAIRTIHDEKAREFAHKRQMDKFNDTIANAGIGMWQITIPKDAPARMTPNDKMRELLGIKRMKLTEEEIYEYWHSRIVPEAMSSVEKSVKKMLSGKFHENTYLWKHPTKGEIYVRCGGTSQTGEDGIQVLSGYHYDVTDIVVEDERKKQELAHARYQAEIANQAKTQFLFAMSHDIRTPMNAIIGFTNLLKTDHEDPVRCKDYVNKILDSSKILLDLINNVLEVARIESGKLVLEEKVCPVGSVTRAINTIFEERMKAKNIRFIKDIQPSETKYIYIDAVKTQEIFLNLVSNAYKYTPEGGTVSITIHELPCEQEGYATFETKISDTGIGMSEEFLPHIFEEFSREKTVTEDRIEGTGLGMPIVKSLLDLMGGTIEVESKLGEGTTFTIVLTHRIGSESELEMNREQKANEIDVAGRRILLAEDNDLNAEIAIALLDRMGIVVDRAEDGTVCVDKLAKSAEGTYDLILMDIQMPYMDGYAATKAIRAMDSDYARNIPIIAMTANAFEEDKKNALEAGMNAHLAKPVDAQIMLQTISQVLGDRAW